MQRLTADQQSEIRARYDGAEEPGTPLLSADISVVLLARDEDGAPLGWGALHHRGGGIAEVKRMYAAPSRRGRGVGKLVLTGLERAARDRGWTRLRLETGPQQPEAVGLYVSAVGPVGRPAPRIER